MKPSIQIINKPKFEPFKKRHQVTIVVESDVSHEDALALAKLASGAAEIFEALENILTKINGPVRELHPYMVEAHKVLDKYRSKQ
ncbi:MAG: hypothetical protein H0X02_03380 [Nitrosomonas sp.]|nr:hypothetical protein [Nitrosomonas sp.]